MKNFYLKNIHFGYDGNMFEEKQGFTYFLDAKENCDYQYQYEFRIGGFFIYWG